MADMRFCPDGRMHMFGNMDFSMSRTCVYCNTKITDEEYRSLSLRRDVRIPASRMVTDLNKCGASGKSHDFITSHVSAEGKVLRCAHCGLFALESEVESHTRIQAEKESANNVTDKQAIIIEMSLDILALTARLESMRAVNSLCSSLGIKPTFNAVDFDELQSDIKAAHDKLKSTTSKT